MYAIGQHVAELIIEYRQSICRTCRLGFISLQDERSAKTLDSNLFHLSRGQSLVCQKRLCDRLDNWPMQRTANQVAGTDTKPF
jgi:hypothetical protein